MLDWLAWAAGLAIVLIVSADIFRSLLVPRASARWLRVGPVLTLVLFSRWQAAANLIPDGTLRQTFRAILAPLMLVLTMAIWATLLIFGFGLLFWVERANFDPSFPTLGDAVYAAGSAFSTLGVQAAVSGDWTRLTVLVCSLDGLAIVTVVATFLISVQNGYGHRETPVLRLESHVDVPPTGVAILECYAREGVIDRLGDFFDAWEAWTAGVAISHRAFPILIFFRSQESRCEWLAALGAVLDAAALLDTTVLDAPPAAKSGARFLLHTGGRVLGEMAGQFGIDAPGSGLIDEDRFGRDRVRLAKAGYRLVADEQAAFASMLERQRAYAHALAMLAQRLHIDLGEPIVRS